MVDCYGKEIGDDGILSLFVWLVIGWEEKRRDFEGVIRGVASFLSVLCAWRSLLLCAVVQGRSSPVFCLLFKYPRVDGPFSELRKENHGGSVEHRVDLGCHWFGVGTCFQRGGRGKKGNNFVRLRFYRVATEREILVSR